MCISLVFPIKSTIITQTDIAAPKPLISPSKKPQTPMMALLVEDNLIARKVVHRLLENANCQIIEASNSTQAYEAFKTHDFDFVLTDIGLPDYSGLELIKQIRQFEKNYQRSKTPVFILSGHEYTDNLASYCTEYDVDGLYKKPLREEELANLLALYHPK